MGAYISEEVNTNIPSSITIEETKTTEKELDTMIDDMVKEITTMMEDDITDDEKVTTIEENNEITPLLCYTEDKNIDAIHVSMGKLLDFDPEKCEGFKITGGTKGNYHGDGMVTEDFGEDGDKYNHENTNNHYTKKNGKWDLNSEQNRVVNPLFGKDIPHDEDDEEDEERKSVKFEFKKDFKQNMDKLVRDIFTRKKVEKEFSYVYSVDDIPVYFSKIDETFPVIKLQKIAGMYSDYNEYRINYDINIEKQCIDVIGTFKFFAVTYPRLLHRISYKRIESV